MEEDVKTDAKRYTITITKDSYERLALTKKLLKRRFRESYAYADIINAALVLMNKELFERNNMEVLGYLSLFKEERLIRTRLEKMKQIQVISDDSSSKKENNETEQLLKKVMSVPMGVAYLKEEKSKKE